MFVVVVFVSAVCVCVCVSLWTAHDKEGGSTMQAKLFKIFVVY